MDLPFPVLFYGQEYSRVRVHTNGLITFGSTYGATYESQPIPTYGGTNTMVAALWTDLSLTSGSGNRRICLVKPTRFDRRLLVTFDGVGYYGVDDGSSTFQVELSNRGEVHLRYATVAPGNPQAVSVGIEGPNGTEGVDLFSSSLSLSDALAVTIYPSQYAAAMPDSAPWEDMSDRTRLTPCTSGGTCYSYVPYPASGNAYGQEFGRIFAHGVVSTSYGLDEADLFRIVRTGSGYAAAFLSASAAALVGGPLGEANPNPDLFFGTDTYGRDVIQWGAGPRGFQLAIGADGSMAVQYGPAFDLSGPSHVGINTPTLGLSPPDLLVLSDPAGRGTFAPGPGRSIEVSRAVPGVSWAERTSEQVFLSAGESATVDITLDALSLPSGRTRGVLPVSLYGFESGAATTAILLDLNVTPCTPARRRAAEEWTLYDACTGGVSGLPSDDVTHVLIEPESGVWAGTPHGLAYLDGDSWVALREADGLPSRRITSLDPNLHSDGGRLVSRGVHVGTDAGPGLASLLGSDPDAGTLVRYYEWGEIVVIDSVLIGPVTSVIDANASFPSRYRKHIGTPTGLYTISEDGSGLRSVSEAGSGPVTDIGVSGSIEFGSYTLWVAREGKGVERWSNGVRLDTTFARPNTRPQLCLENAVALDVDDEGVVRVLYYDYGDGNRDYYDSGDELCQGASSARLAGATERRRRMATYDGSTWTSRPVAERPASARMAAAGRELTGLFTDIETSPDGIVWISAQPFDDGTGGGIAFSTDADEVEWTLLTTETSGLPSNNVRDLSVDPRNGDLWIATDAGVVRYSPPLVAVSLALPAADVEGVPLAPALSWSRAPGAAEYQVRVAQDAAFTTLVVEPTVTDNTFAFDTPLDANATYFWQVRYRRGDDLSDWSTPRQFTTGGRSWAQRDSAPLAVHLAPNGDLWVSTDAEGQRKTRFDRATETWTGVDLPFPYTSPPADAFAGGGDGSAWVAIPEFGIFADEFPGAILRVDADGTSEVVLDGLSSVQHLAADDSGAWAVADETLYDLLSRSELSRVESARAVLPDGNGGVWIWDVGLTSTSGQRAPDLGTINDVYRSSTGTVWIATANGIARFAGAEWLPTGLAVAATEVAERNGVVWAVQSAGLARGTSPYGPSDWETFGSLPGGPVGGGLKEIEVDAGGNAWGVVDGQAFVFDGSAWNRFDRTNVAFRGNARRVFAHASGDIWVETDEEIARTSAASISGGPGPALTTMIPLNGPEGWHLLAAPVGGATVGDLLGPVWTQGFPGADAPQGGATVLLYDEAAACDADPATEAPPCDASTGYRVPAAAAVELASGAGLFAYLFEDDDPTADGVQGGFPKALSVTGVPPALPFAFPALSYTDTRSPADDGWTLAGNPLPGPIDWDAPGWTRTDVSDAVYVYDPAAAEYRTWNGVAGTLGGGVLPAGQGFWVKATGPAPALVAPEAAAAPATARSTAETRPVAEALELRLTGPTPDGPRGSSVLVVAAEGAEVGPDALDAYALAPPAPAYVLASASAPGDDRALAIAAVPPAALAGGLEFALAADHRGLDAGPLAWTWSLPEGAGWTATLTDVETGATVDLAAQSEYAFEPGDSGRRAVDDAPPALLLGPAAAARSDAGRFVLRVARAAVAGEGLPTELAVGAPSPNPVRARAHVRYALPTPSDVEVGVYDLLGRRVASVHAPLQPAGYHAQPLDAGALAAGVYVVRVHVRPQGGEPTVVTHKLTVVR